jgi:hypothetical protein
MPRKQRFKPSRKPKPSPQTETAPIGHAVHNDNVSPSEAPPRGRDGSSQEPDTDSPLR